MHTSTTPTGTRTRPTIGRRTVRTAIGFALAGALAFAGCGSDDGDSGEGVTGTYTHVEEGTIVLEADGDGTITQSGDPVPFTYEVEDDTLLISIDGEVKAEADTSDGDLTFRAGDFSGDEPVTFTKA